MNRRNFLKMMLGGAAVAVAGPALALVPSPKPKQDVFYGPAIKGLMNGKIGRIDGFDIYHSGGLEEGDVIEVTGSSFNGTYRVSDIDGPTLHAEPYIDEAAKQLTNQIDDDLLDAIVRMGKALDDADVPKHGRWIPVHPSALRELGISA